jgi:hypothetical protein
MKILRLICSVGVMLGIMNLVALTEWAYPKAGVKGPVITGSYAVDKGRYGSIWRIYLEAEGTDAEMIKVAAVVDQPGQGHYPTDFILLDPQYRNHLKGFLQWNTFSSKGATLKEGTQITLRVSVIDRAGNESKEAVFPFVFVSGIEDQATPAPFDRENIPRIGHIGIDLISPDRGGGM